MEQSFDQFNAALLYCNKCRRAMPVRERLLLVLPDGELWLFSRRNAIVLAIPFALGGVWTAYLLAILLYAVMSFFIVQRVRHSPSS